MGIAGLICLVAACGEESPKLRTTLVQTASAFVIPGFLLIPTGAFWHVAVMPSSARNVLLHQGNPMTVFFASGLVISVLVAAFVAAVPLRKPKICTRVVALAVFLLGLLAVASTEWAIGWLLPLGIVGSG